MDINQLIARAKALLLTPKTEWPVIAAEPTTVADLYKNYIVVLAAIPAVAGFIKASLIGYSGFGFHYRAPIGAGLTSATFGYGLSLLLVYVMSLIVNALAPSFDGEKNPIQALKAVAYAYTASWIAGVGVILPGIGWLIALAGGIYSIYLLYLGLSPTMKSPEQKGVGYTAVSIIIAAVLGWIITLLVAGIAGTGAVMSGALSNPQLGSSGVTIDENSPFGKLAAISQHVDAASKQMEAAQKSGDAHAQGEALGAMIGAATGAGQVEALTPELLKPFVPDSLGGLKRTGYSAERNGALGMQISETSATYSDGGQRSLQLKITDMGSAKGLMALAGFASLDSDKQTDHGYEKTYKQDGRLIQEEWNSRDKYGEYSIVLGGRFNVKVSGNADSIDQLKAAVASLKLRDLEALKDQGVKKG